MTAAANDNAIELRCGRWQDVLADVECDALIADPPYSERTHARMYVGTTTDPATSIVYERKTVPYAHWTNEEASLFVQHWAPRTRGWLVIITDDRLAPVIQDACDACGRYAFQPLPFVELGKQPRVSGDGPASWTCWIVVSRPRQRRFQSWGSLPGAYVPPLSSIGLAKAKPERIIKGGKSLWLMQQLVRDYSRPGDLICDPCAGGATTLLAAAIEGRRAIGAEMDPDTYAKAQARIARGYTPVMQFTQRAAPEQQDLLAAMGDKP